MIWMIHNVAWSLELSKLCLPQENVLFSCDAEGGKSISLCAGETENWNSYVQYRFGDSPRNGLFFPIQTEQSLAQFTYNNNPSQIAFVYENLQYKLVQQEQTEDIEPFSGVIITTKEEQNKEILRIPCASPPFGQLHILENAVGVDPTKAIFENRLRGFVDLPLYTTTWGPISVFETSQSSKRSKDTLSFISYVSLQQKYAFRLVGQSQIFYDEVRFVGWQQENSSISIQETDKAVPFALREYPSVEDVFWIRKTDLHPLFLQRRGKVLSNEPWLCCKTISLYASSQLEDKQGEIFVEEIQQESMQLVWYQADQQKQKVISLHPKDVQDVGYDLSYLNFFDKKHDRIQILNHSLPNGLWLPTKNIYGYQHITIEAFLAGKQEALFPEMYDDIHMYSQPNYQPEYFLHTLQNDSYVQLRPTGDFVQGWLEVVVEEYTGPHNCGEQGEATGRIWKGWLPVLTANGEPTIWFYTRGC